MKFITFVSSWTDNELVEVRVFTEDHFLCFDDDGFSCSPMTPEERERSIANHHKHTWHEVE